MSSAQKVIKGVAIAFAIFLIFTIFSAIISAGYGLLKVTGAIDSYTKSDIDHSKYTSYLDINLKYSKLKIEKGNELKVDNNNDKVKVELDGNRLYITDNSNIFTKNKDKELIVYVPEDMIYDIVNISTGAGDVFVEGFKTNKLMFDLGAGRAIISNIEATNVDINSGAGKLEINNSNLNNSKFDLGVGDITINANLSGKSEINCGIGKVALYLPLAEHEYSFDIDKGIGSINLNGKELDDGTINGIGNNSISIDGGIGEIVINTK